MSAVAQLPATMVPTINDAEIARISIGFFKEFYSGIYFLNEHGLASPCLVKYHDAIILLGIRHCKM